MAEAIPGAQLLEIDGASHTAPIERPTLVDTTMGAAVRSAADGEGAATSQLSVTYLRPGKPGTLVVTATVRKRGESLTVCEADVAQDGKSLVHALATFALIAG